VVSLGTYAMGSAMFGGSVSHGALVAGAVMGFMLGYLWLWRMLLTEAEAGQIRQFLGAWQPRTPSRMPPIVPAVAAPRLAASPGSTAEPAAGGPEPAQPGDGEEPFPVHPERLAVVQDGFMTVIGYLHRSLAEVLELGRYAIDGRLDGYNTFGCHLFFAGACEGFARERRLEPTEVRWMLAEALEKIAFDAKGARNFARNYQEYLTQPSYLEAFKAGIEGIRRHLTGEEAGEPPLVAALERWNRPEAKTAKADFVVVLLTDLVGSTAFTQAHGDAANLDLVRRHNDIVRMQLVVHGGREIKHTGDGIMAVFGSAQEAVAAATGIQRGVAEHNRRAPALEMHLRIGINAGEPIAEGDELYGSTVQIAQTACAAGGADEIIVAAVVQGLATGRGFAFADRGRSAGKGGAAPVELYAVAWR
jgi:class 3 adenylate cyclase